MPKVQEATVEGATVERGANVGGTSEISLDT